MSYHHGDLRQAILDAACGHLRCENADTLSLRALAREIGVSQAAPYRHFDSRNALFAGIATWGFRILEQALRETLCARAMRADEAMIEMGLTYLQFSEQHAEKYQLCFGPSLVDFDEYPELQQASASCFDILLGVIRRGKAEAVFQSRDDEALAAVAWAGLHGMASLLQMIPWQDDGREVPVATALGYLSEQRKHAISTMLVSILK